MLDNSPENKVYIISYLQISYEKDENDKIINVSSR